MAARRSSVSTLWHQQYRHLNVHYLSQLAREELVLGLPDIQTQQLGVCDACQARKQHHTPFTSGDSWRASQSSPHKAYILINTETSRLLYSRDVDFDEQRGPFMSVSHVPDPSDQPMKAHDLGVRLSLGPPNGRARIALAAPVIPMIPIQTPPTSPARSPRLVDASPKFDPDSSDEESDH